MIEATVIFELGELRAIKVVTDELIEEGETLYELFVNGQVVYKDRLYHWANTWREIDRGCIPLLAKILDRVGEFDADLVQTTDRFGIQRHCLLFPGQEQEGVSQGKVSVTKDNFEKIAMNWHTRGNWANIADLLPPTPDRGKWANG